MKKNVEKSRLKECGHLSCFHGCFQSYGPYGPELIV